MEKLDSSSDSVNQLPFYFLIMAFHGNMLGLRQKSRKIAICNDTKILKMLYLHDLILKLKVSFISKGKEKRFIRDFIAVDSDIYSASILERAIPTCISRLI